MRKYAVLILGLLFLLLFPAAGRAASAETHINLDGRELELTGDMRVQVVNQIVMVPLRIVTEEMGYSVGYDNKTQTVTIKQGGTVLQLTIGKAAAQVNGKTVQLQAAPLLSGSQSTKTTFVPLRFVGEQTGAEVSWDNHTKTVYIASAAEGSEGAVLPGAGNADADANAVPKPGSGQGEAAQGGGDNGGENGLSGGQPAVLNNLSFSDNKLTLAVDGDVTPNAFAMTDNDRIVIDLANTSFAADFGGGVLPLDAKQSGSLPVQGYPGVVDVRYAMFSSDPLTVRVVLDLTGPMPYRVVSDDGLLTIDLNSDSALPAGTAGGTTPTSGASGKKLVVIDAGHGGTDSGAVSLKGRFEKDFTLATALKVQALLSQDPQIEVVMTRTTDTYPTLQDRVDLANSLNADVFISIHGNKSPDGGPGPSGAETHYTKKSGLAESLALAQIMQKHLLSSTGLKDRGLKPDNLFVNKNTKMPAVLLECGFLSNPGDEAAMYSDDFQQRLAGGIADGLREFLGLTVPAK